VGVSGVVEFLDIFPIPSCFSPLRV
jgi:hypothetical protein